MINKVAVMYEQVMMLSKDERQKLMQLLTEAENGQPLPAEIEHVWNAEAARRYRDYQSGKAAAIPADDVLQRLESRFSR